MAASNWYHAMHAMRCHSWTAPVTLAFCRMNPLGLDPQRFLVAEDARTSQVLGIAQLQPQAGFQELRTLIVEPASRCVRSGSVLSTGVAEVSKAICTGQAAAVAEG